MKYAIIILTLFLASCSTQKQIVVQEKYIKLNITKIDLKKQEKLNGIETSSINNSIVIDEENYKKLISNFYIMNNTNSYLKSIIKYYEQEIDKYNEEK